MTEEKKKSGEISRREFLKDAGLLVGGTAIGSTVLLAACGGETVTETATKTITAAGGTKTVTADGVTSTVTADGVTSTSTVTEAVDVSKFICPIDGMEFDTFAELKAHFDAEHSGELPLSEGYLLVDPKKCSGCLTCMMACSVAHDGKENFSLSRIQILQTNFSPYGDVVQAVCRQCVDPLCVKACPTGACHVDTANGNVRVIDESICIGCQMCIQACPFIPHRTIFNAETNKATKCDLCINTPYWDGDGPACVAVCPNSAIKLTTSTPTQRDDDGYVVNLRQEDAWGALGWPTD